MALLAACSLGPANVTRPAVMRVRIEPPTAVSCPAQAAERCAMASPLRALADPAVASAAPVAIILDVGREALIARVNLIRAARRSISVQTFIWAGDASGRLLLGELLAAARRGVKVRVLVDQLVDGMTPEFLARLAISHANLEMRVHNPVDGRAIADAVDYTYGALMHFEDLNHRMHNKLVVVDERVGIAGGRNVQDRYFDLDPYFDFIDRDVLIGATAVAGMEASFDAFWDSEVSVPIEQLRDVREVLVEHDQGRKLRPVEPVLEAPLEPVIRLASDADYVRSTFVDAAFPVAEVYYASDPPVKRWPADEEASAPTSRELREVVSGMRRSLLVQTPYPVLSDSAYAMLLALRKRTSGLEYTVSTNSLASADHYYVYALAFKRRRRNVEELDFNIYELTDHPADSDRFVAGYASLAARARVERGTDPALPWEPSTLPRLSIHAKSLVIDERIAVIGSHNFDPRSRHFNTENVVFVHDDAFAAALARSIRRATAPGNSWLVARREQVPVLGEISDVVGALSRALPVFDMWPFRWTTSFALRAGKRPVPRRHPRFYDHYEDVGQFPGVGLDPVQVKVLLVSGFGAIAEPFM